MYQNDCPFIQPLSGWGYYHSSNAVHVTNTVQEKATSVMCDSDTCFYVGVLFSYGSANFININYIS